MKRLGVVLASLWMCVFLSQTVLGGVDFLAEDYAQCLSISDAWLDKTEMGVLWDDDPESGMELLFGKSRPLDFVFEVQKGVISPHALEMVFRTKTSKQSKFKIEILSSTLSPKTGFQTLYEKTMNPALPIQTFQFEPLAAKWIMIRFKATYENQKINVADISILGELGAPHSNYAFQESPSSALDVIRQLKKTSSDFKISQDERELFKDVQDKKLNEWTFAESLLVASGIQTAKKREIYLEKIKKLTLDAKATVDKGKTTYKKGERLLSWLHQRVLISRYQEEQTNIAVLLDTGRYNCVSASAVYMLIGRQLGLDIRGIEVPDHAFAIFYEGARHVDVESTSGVGFDPAGRPEVLRRFTEKTGFNYISEENQDKRREVNGPGMVALIYYNQGVLLAEQKKYQAALLANFKALNMDQEIKTAVHNVLAILANWSKALVEQQHYALADDVVEVGLSLAPRDSTLRNNQKALWEQRITTAVEKKQSQKALELLKIAMQRMPEENYERLQAWVFIKPSMDYIHKNQWQKALAVAEPGKMKLSSAAAQELKAWKRNIYLEWSNALVKKKQFEKAMQVLETAKHIAPQDTRYVRNQGFALFSWAKDLKQKKGFRAAERLLLAQLKQYPTEIEIQRAGEAYVSLLLEAISDNKNKDIQIARIIKRCAGLVQTVPGMNDQVRNAYDILGLDLYKKEKWEQALAIYQEAIVLFPEDEKLRHNYRVVWEHWLDYLVREKKWEKALDVNEKAIVEKFSGDYFFRKQAKIVEVYVEDLFEREGSEKAESMLRQLMAMYKSNQYVQRNGEQYIRNRFKMSGRKADTSVMARKVLARNRDLLEVKAIADEFDKKSFDKQARGLAQQEKWRAAIAVYHRALKKYPHDAVLKNNQIAMWDQWINQGIHRQDWPLALERCKHAMTEVNDQAHFENKLAFVVQEYTNTSLVKRDTRDLEKALKKMIALFPDRMIVRKVISGVVGQKIQGLPIQSFENAEQRFNQIILGYANSLGQDENYQQFIRIAYDRLAQVSGDKGDWQFMVSAYSRALERVPEDTHLQKNLIAVWNNWGNTFIKAQQWQQAIGIYNQALERFPENQMLINNKQFCEQEIRNRATKKNRQP